METIKTKILSDRLWMLLLFVGIVVGNSLLDIGISDTHMTALAFAVISFVLGKSWRETYPGGGLIEALVPQAIEAVPQVIARVKTGRVNKKSDVDDPED